MKKKILSLMFTLVLLIGLVAAVGVNASAATDVSITAAIELCTYDDLAGYLEQLRPKSYFKLTGDIEVTDDEKNLSLPVDASGTFVLDLNGYDIIINSDNTTSIFNVGSNFSTEFHVINSASARSEITLNSIADKASVFYINDARSSLHIYDNISINVAADGINYFHNPNGRVITYGIRAGLFDTIAIHGADIYNRSAFGGGVLFSANVPGSKFIIDGDTEIISRFVGLNFAGIGSVDGYPDIQLKALHLAYDNANPPVDGVSYSKVSSYTAIGGLGTTKTKDIIGSSMQAFYGTSEPYSRFFSNDSDLIKNLPTGNNLRIYSPGCGHYSGYECCLRLFVPDQRPLHFTICSYCAKKPTYSACTFVSKAEATEAADGHTAGYDCYCGYKTNAKIAKIASVKLEKTKYTYDAKVKTPTVTVKDSAGKTLKKDTDYTVTYASGRKNTGKYAVTVTFKGNYSGEKVLYFTIYPKQVTGVKATQTTTTIKLTWDKVTGATGYRIFRYNTSTKKWDIVVKKTTANTYTFKDLKPGTKYLYSVRNYKTVSGTIYWAEAGTRIQTATKTVAPAISKLTTGSKYAKLTWADVAGETGYQVWYSTSKTGTYKRYGNAAANAKTLTVKNLTSGTTYYFKIRTYIKTTSGYVYSDYSPVKSIKVK